MLKNVVSEKVTENMWNKIIGLKLYNDINRLSKYLKINTNIQQNKFYFNKIVAENAKKEYDNLDKKSQDEFMVEFNEKDWSKDCHENFNTCKTKSEPKDIQCNLKNYTKYIHLVGGKISKSNG